MQGRHVDPLGAVYAEALAQVAEGQGGLDLLRDVGARLSAAAEAWRTGRTLRAYFLSAEVPARAKAAAIERIAEAQPAVLGNFLRLLQERGRLAWLPEIGDAYEAILDRRLGRVAVTLTTAVPVPDDRVDAWVDSIRKATGKEPVLERVVKPHLVAGAVLKVGDTVADGSARRRLAELRKHIMERAKHALQS